MDLDLATIELTQSVGPAPRVPTQGAGLTRDQAREVGKEFESVFLTEMLRPIFDSLETNELFGGGSGERIMSSMMIDQYGQAMAKNSDSARSL